MGASSSIILNAGVAVGCDDEEQHHQSQGVFSPRRHLSFSNPLFVDEGTLTLLKLGDVGKNHSSLSVDDCSSMKVNYGKSPHDSAPTRECNGDERTERIFDTSKRTIPSK